MAAVVSITEYNMSDMYGIWGMGYGYLGSKQYGLLHDCHGSYIHENSA